MYGMFFITVLNLLTSFAPGVPMAPIVINGTLYALAGMGIGRMYRSAAVLGFGYFFLNLIIAAVAGQNPAGILTIALILLFFTAVRATYSFHSLLSKAKGAIGG